MNHPFLFHVIYPFCSCILNITQISQWTTQWKPLNNLQMLVMSWSVHQSVSGVLEVEDCHFQNFFSTKTFKFSSELSIRYIKYTTILLWHAVCLWCIDINSYSGVDIIFYWGYSTCCLALTCFSSIVHMFTLLPPYLQ